MEGREKLFLVQLFQQTQSVAQSNLGYTNIGKKT